MVSINRKKLETDNSEKLAPIVKKHKTEFFEIFLGIVEVGHSHTATQQGSWRDGRGDFP